MIAPLILFWLAMAVGLASRRSVLLTIFFVAASFGAMAVVPTGMTAGVTVLPQVTCALMLCLWLAVRRGKAGEMAAAAIDTRNLGVLFLFLIYCGVVTAFLPVIFEGRVNVIPFRSAAPGTSPLAPTPSNLTQILYLCASCLTAVVFHVLWREQAMRRKILSGLLIGGGALVLTGLADMATRGTEWLAPFRTASYAMMTNDDVLGVKRVVGLMSEASAYGGACVAFGAALYFLRGSFEFLGARRWRLTAIVAGLFAMALASTSTSAYAGLCVFAVLAAVNFVRRLVFARGAMRRADFAEDIVAFYVIAGVILGIVLFNRHAIDFVLSMVDRIVLDKAASSSFVERSYWNTVAMDALRESHWLGVGIGSTRVSSWPVAIVSNAGVLGALILSVFGLLLYTRRTDGLEADGREAATGMKLAVIVALSMASLAATTPDFGLLVGALVGGISGLAAAARGARMIVTPNPYMRFSRGDLAQGGAHGAY